MPGRHSWQRRVLATGEHVQALRAGVDPESAGSEARSFCCLCDAPARILFTAPDHSAAWAYCLAHYLGLRDLPPGAICSRLQRVSELPSEM